VHLRLVHWRSPLQRRCRERTVEHEDCKTGGESAPPETGRRQRLVARSFIGGRRRQPPPLPRLVEVLECKRSFSVIFLCFLDLPRVDVAEADVRIYLPGFVQFSSVIKGSSIGSPPSAPSLQPTPHMTTSKPPRPHTCADGREPPGSSNSFRMRMRESIGGGILIRAATGSSFFGYLMHRSFRVMG